MVLFSRIDRPLEVWIWVSIFLVTMCASFYVYGLWRVGPSLVALFWYINVQKVIKFWINDDLRWLWLLFLNILLYHIDMRWVYSFYNFIYVIKTLRKIWYIMYSFFLSIICLFRTQSLFLSRNKKQPLERVIKFHIFPGALHVCALLPICIIA